MLKTAYAYLFQILNTHVPEILTFLTFREEQYVIDYLSYNIKATAMGITQQCIYIFVLIFKQKKMDINMIWSWALVVCMVSKK